MSDWVAQVDRLREQAAAIAAPIAQAARRRTTIGQERAILRLLGVDGLDSEGRPLAACVAEACCGDPETLAAGVALPFGAALCAYDAPPRDLALDVAAGDVDLRLEGEVLSEPVEAAQALAAVSQLALAALERIDANRTASRELRAVLGELPPPWLAAEVAADEVRAAADEVRRLVAAGAGLLRVRVPANWELRQMIEPEAEGPAPEESRRVRGRRAPTPAPKPVEKVPAGSQRGLAVLRDAADRAAAERGAFVSLMTVTSPLSAPEQAVVAALERIDFVEADGIREIVEGSVAPDRALADHSFARRLHARSGCRLLVSPGPLAIEPELEAGVPADLPTRAGRALALQALEVELALADGLAADRLIVGTLPEWLAGTADPSAAIAQAWLRAVVFPDHPLAFAEAAGLGGRRLLETVDAIAGMHAGRVFSSAAGHAFPRRPATPLFILAAGDVANDSSADVRVAGSTAASLAQSLGDGTLRHQAAALAESTLVSANHALERFAAQSWSAVLGAAAHLEAERLGEAAVVDRESQFDLLEVWAAARV